MWKLITTCCSILSLVLGLPTIEDNELDFDEAPTCSDVFSDEGLNYTSFSKGVAHGIHSLSLEEIRHFFKRDATENNHIPTVNIDFRSEKIIHFNAPLWGYEDKFDTWALKIMDWFMLNDQPYLYTKQMNTMEKISHQYHMHEIYQRASNFYKSLEENPPSKKVCNCATDLTETGIMNELVNIATKQNLFYSTDPWTPNTLDGPDQWVPFSSMLVSSLPTDKKIRDFGYFIYCMLN